MGLPVLAFMAWLCWPAKKVATSQSAPTTTNQNVPLRTHTVAILPRSSASSNVVASISSAPSAVGNEPPIRAAFVPRRPTNVFEVQIALACQAISPGSLDGVMGSQTRAAIRAFQERESLPVTGDWDRLTADRLILNEPPERVYTVTSNDVTRLTNVGRTWLAKSAQKRLGFESVLELVAEQGRAYPSVIRSLNPSVEWANIVVGDAVTIPNVEYPPVRSKASLIRIHLAGRVLQAFDHDRKLLAHFPCSIARQIEKRPIGQLAVEEIVLNPSYRFDPTNFPESAEAQELGRKLLIPAGPNNPVGTAWIGLNRSGYGIHGTPQPEDVGRTESHGCFRLANWNVEYLAQLVKPGTPVMVEP